MDFDTKQLDITQKLNGDIQLTFIVDKQYKGNIEALSELFADDSIKVLKVGKKRQKRSLNANAYFYVLQNKLASLLRTDERLLHHELLRRYGQIAEDKDGNKMIFSILSDINLPEDKEGFYFKVTGRGKTNEKEFTHYVFLKGSSEMDTREFSILLDGLISECKEVGIQTMTPQELAQLQGYERR